MGFIIVTRNPGNKKLVVIAANDQDDVAEFETESEATKAADETTVCRAWGYQLVGVD